MLQVLLYSCCLEYDHSLAQLSLRGKIAGAFFGSVTARTAGSNSVDMNLFAPATVLIYFVLMWIGASPASTGGGIKTTTFSLAIMNVVSIAKGKDRIEIFGREISNESVRGGFLSDISFIPCNWTGGSGVNVNRW